MTNQLGRSLAKLRDSGDNCWPELNKLFEINTLPDERRYRLPDDYYDIIKKTAWSVNDFERLDDPLSPDQWAYHQHALADISLYPRFRIAADASGKYVDIDPVPSGEDVIQFQYISKNWVRGGGEVFTADTEEPIFDEYIMELGLIASYAQRRGLPFAYELGVFEMERNRQLANANGKRDINLGREYRGNWNRQRHVGIGVRISAE